VLTETFLVCTRHCDLVRCTHVHSYCLCTRMLSFSRCLLPLSISPSVSLQRLPNRFVPHLLLTQHERQVVPIAYVYSPVLDQHLIPKYTYTHIRPKEVTLRMYIHMHIHLHLIKAHFDIHLSGAECKSVMLSPACYLFILFSGLIVSAWPWLPKCPTILAPHTHTHTRKKHTHTHTHVRNTRHTKKSQVFDSQKKTQREKPTLVTRQALPIE